jgi:hypothetical protein
MRSVPLLLLPAFQASCDNYSSAFLLRRQMMINSTTTARRPAVIRINVGLTVFSFID